MGYEWIESNVYDALPSNAVWCGKDPEGFNVYFGKIAIADCVIGAKILPQKRDAYVAYNGKVLPILNYQILINTNNAYQIWVRVTGDMIPTEGVECGFDKNDIKLVVGRAFHKGYLIPGYVNTRTRIIHIPFDGKEYKYDEFEILISYNSTNY